MSTGTRLPASVSSFVGRAAELAAVDDALRSNRLVTLAGPGGMGKTRIALTAGRSASGLPVFVDLTRVRQGEPVALAVAQAVGLRGVKRKSAVEALLWWLDAHAPVLLILDNAEHLLEAAAEMAVALLEGSEGARLLVTSRQPLGITGERVIAVGPMAPSDAETLFWDRARAVQPRLADTEESRRASRELCERLDHLPLALELAAARTAVLTPDEMLPLLEQRFEALGPGSSTAPLRHRSLRACIAASVDALEPPLRAVFEACSVFASPFDARAAAAVALATLGDLESLVARSLLQATPDAEGRTRFRLLESLREYAREGLEASERGDEARRRHLAWIASIFGADRFPATLESSLNGTAVDRLPELRAALDIAAAVAPDVGLRLMATSRELWFRVAQDEGLERTLSLLDRYSAGDEARACGLVAAAVLHAVRQETAAAIGCTSEALAYWPPDSDGAALAWFHQGVAKCLSRDLEGAEAAARASLAAYSSLGDEPGQSRATSLLGMIAVWAGHDAEAITHLDRALALAEACGDTWSQGQSLTYLGLAQSDLGRVGAGRASLFAAVDRFAEVGDTTLWGIALARLAALAVGERPTTAVRAAASATRREGRGGKYHAIALADLERTRTTGELLLGLAAFSAAWEAGTRLTFAEATAELRLPLDPAEPGILSGREREIADLVRLGESNAAIAGLLTLSVRTVENHVAHALTKLGLPNRAALAVWAAEHARQT